MLHSNALSLDSEDPAVSTLPREAIGVSVHSHSDGKSMYHVDVASTDDITDLVIASSRFSWRPVYYY